MNDQMAKFLEELSKKLGTTSEYLWGVLIKQAYVDATITLLYFILVCISGIILYKYHKKFSIKKPITSYKNESIYESDEGDIVIPIMIVLAIIWGITFLALFFNLDSIINGYFNPEYWALDKVLDTIN